MMSWIESKMGVKQETVTSNGGGESRFLVNLFGRNTKHRNL